jgi:hypothetical protein
MVTALSQLRSLFPAERRTPAQDSLIGESCLALSREERKCVADLLNQDRAFSAYREDKNLGIERQIDRYIGKCQGVGATIGAISGVIVGGGVAGLATMPTGPLGIGLSVAVCGAVVGTAGGAVGCVAGGKVGEKRIIRRLKESAEFIQWKAERYEQVAIPALRQFLTSPEGESIPDALPYPELLENLRGNYNERIDKQHRVLDAHRIGVDPAERDQIIHDAHMTDQEVRQVVQFYGSTSVQRSDIAYPMIREVIGSDMPDEKKDFLIDFLSFPLTKDPVKI